MFHFLSLFIFTSLFASESYDLKTMNVSMPTNYGVFLGEIHYHSADLPQALRVERVIREDLQKVINYFEYVPRDIVHFNLDPQMRLTNGSAMNFTTNVINLYNYPASNNEHLITIENWIQGLVLHEFIHISHLDQTRGFWDVARTLFGTIAKLPTAIVPRWFTEGIAVWGESHLIAGGRLNNVLYEKDLENYFNDPSSCKTIECLDFPKTYPSGNLSYWAGSRFIEWLEVKKPKTIKCLVEINSDRFPFFLNDAFRECTDKTAQENFMEFVTSFQTSHTHNVMANATELKNQIGIDETPKGLGISDKFIYKVERDRYTQYLVAYKSSDLSFSHSKKFQISIDHISQVDVENNKLLVAFNDNYNYLDHNKVWKLLSGDDFSVLENLKFKDDPSYVFKLGDKRYLTASYNDNHWVIKDEDKIIFDLNADYNINYLNLKGQNIYLKLTDGAGHAHLLVSNKENINFKVLYESAIQFEILGLTQNTLYIKSHSTPSQFFQIENNANHKWQISELSSDQSIKSIASLHQFDKTTLIYDQNYSAIQKADFLIIPKSTKDINTNELKIIAAQKSSFTSDLAENFPRFDHMIPHYWFVDFMASTNQYAVGAQTTLSDPMNIYQAFLHGLYYPNLRKFGYSFEYDQSLVKISHLLNATFLANESFDTKSTSKIIQDIKSLRGGISYNIYWSRLLFRPEFYIRYVDAVDYNSKYNEVQMGLRPLLSYQALNLPGSNDFFKLITSDTMLYNVKRSSNHFNVIDSTFETTLAPLDGFLINYHAGYAKQFKPSNLTNSGSISGGGINSALGSYRQPFYGILNGDIFGKEIYSQSGNLEANLWNIFKGHGFMPAFLRELHFFFGAQSIHGDTFESIQLTNPILNAHLTGLYMGAKLKSAIFYTIPVSFELIYSQNQTNTGYKFSGLNYTMNFDYF